MKPKSTPYVKLHAPKMPFRKLAGWAARMLCLGAATVPLLANAPAKQDYSYTATVVINVCGFPVTLQGTVTGTATFFFDNSGNIVRIQFQQTEQDVFSAYGKSLRGLPFTNNTEVLVDAAGNLTHIYATGGVEKVLLPDGSLFISAGRVDALNQIFVIAPDEGHSGNLDAFCAALAP
jgi:hypothetical protein